MFIALYIKKIDADQRDGRWTSLVRGSRGRVRLGADTSLYLSIGSQWQLLMGMAQGLLDKEFLGKRGGVFGKEEAAQSIQVAHDY